jgi:hypothetical protein
MDVGGDHPSTASQHARELPEHRRKVAYMRERQGARDHVDRRVVERKVLQLAAAKVARGHLRPRDVEHRVGRVDADHVVAERRKVRGVTAGPARGVEGTAARRVVEERVHDGLFDRDRGVRTVVRRRPVRVAVVDVVFDERERQRLRELVVVLDDAVDVGGTRPRRVAVHEHAAHEREPRDREEVLTGDQDIPLFGHARDF